MTGQEAGMVHHGVFVWIRPLWSASVASMSSSTTLALGSLARSRRCAWMTCAVRWRRCSSGLRRSRGLSCPGCVRRVPAPIVQISSQGGRMAGPGVSAYCAAKFALEGLSEAIAGEVAPFGVRVLIVEPGNFRTGLLGQSMHTADPMEEYASTVGVTRSYFGSEDGRQLGDPGKAATAIIAALDSDEPPLRLVLGPDAFGGYSCEVRGAQRGARALGVARTLDQRMGCLVTSTFARSGRVGSIAWSAVSTIVAACQPMSRSIAASTRSRIGRF